MVELWEKEQPNKKKLLDQKNLILLVLRNLNELFLKKRLKISLEVKRTKNVNNTKIN